VRETRPAPRQIDPLHVGSKAALIGGFLGIGTAGAISGPPLFQALLAPSIAVPVAVVVYACVFRLSDMCGPRRRLHPDSLSSSTASSVRSTEDGDRSVPE